MKQYAATSSEWLANAIQYGEFDATRKRSNSINNLSTADMILDLQARGINMTSAIEQMQAEREPKKVVASAGVETHGVAEGYACVLHRLRRVTSSISNAAPSCRILAVLPFLTPPPSLRIAFVASLVAAAYLPRKIST